MGPIEEEQLGSLQPTSASSSMERRETKVLAGTDDMEMTMGARMALAGVFLGILSILAVGGISVYLSVPTVCTTPPIPPRGRLSISVTIIFDHFYYIITIRGGVKSCFLSIISVFIIISDDQMITSSSLFSDHRQHAEN